MLVIVFYYTFREVSQIYDLYQSGKLNFDHYNAWNIVDILRIMLVAFSCILFTSLNQATFGVATIIDPDGLLKTIVIFTTTILWISVLNLLKNIFLTFAMFVQSLVFIISSL